MAHGCSPRVQTIMAFSTSSAQTCFFHKSAERVGEMTWMPSLKKLLQRIRVIGEQQASLSYVSPRAVLVVERSLKSQLIYCEERITSGRLI